ncbi:energy-coupling factor transporter transmembrane protein EcfT [Leucobacter sp. cx-328]|uniref:energy-coupling factor transporter transmembrane component T family protein n=1 Tax=unclassified Leucobacter TaxID=2621730 RepID=UPI00165E5CD9|nr:energy-coupling factor transporter transmembrane protein EcfT [Leucobacter sp. cx-328]
MSTAVLGAYIPGGGPLHRLRPGAKLLGLIGFSVAVIATSGVIPTAIALALGIALALLAGLRGRGLLRVARGFAIVAVLLFAFQLWQSDWQHAFDVVGGLFALILAASALTASTSAADMLETLTWALGPLRIFGVRPDRVALTFSLAIRAIPSMLEVGRETADAARARGLERSPRARLVPFVLRAVAQAERTGEALAARGLDEADRA